MFSQSAKDRRFLIHAAAVACVICSGVFFNLRDYRTLGSHETYATVPARGMLETGDWVVPRIGQEPRLRKPPLAYWMIAASARAVGEVNELSARLPQALSGIALTALIGLWAGRRYGQTAGICAALVQGTSVYFITFARKAEIDMFQCLCTTLALYLIVHSPHPEQVRSRWFRWIGIYALISLTWLAKFHFGIAMVFAPAGLWMIGQRRYRQVLCFMNPVGLLLLSAAILIWPWLLLQQIPDAWEVWKTQTIGRAVGDMGHQPFWYYIPHLFWLTMPWTPVILMAIPQSWNRAWKQRDGHEQFLWLWFLTDLLICTVSANKHSHYLIVALPMLSLITGARLQWGIEQLRAQPRWIRRRSATAWSIVIAAGAAILYFVAGRKYPFLDAPLAVISIIVAVGSATAVLLAGATRNRAAGYAFLLTLAACLIGVHGWIFPRYDHRVAARNFVREVRTRLGDSTEVCAYHMDLTAVEFYVNEPCQRVESVEQLESYLLARPDEAAYIVAFESELPLFEPIGTVERLATMSDIPGYAPSRHSPLVLARVHQVARPVNQQPAQLAQAPDGNSTQR